MERPGPPAQHSVALTPPRRRTRSRLPGGLERGGRVRGASGGTAGAERIGICAHHTAGRPGDCDSPPALGCRVGLGWWLWITGYSACRAERPAKRSGGTAARWKADRHRVHNAERLAKSAPAAMSSRCPVQHLQGGQVSQESGWQDSVTGALSNVGLGIGEDAFQRDLVGKVAGYRMFCTICHRHQRRKFLFTDRLPIGTAGMEMASTGCRHGIRHLP